MFSIDSGFLRSPISRVDSASLQSSAFLRGEAAPRIESVRNGPFRLSLRNHSDLIVMRAFVCRFQTLNVTSLSSVLRAGADPSVQCS